MREHQPNIGPPAPSRPGDVIALGTLSQPFHLSWRQTQVGPSVFQSIAWPLKPLCSPTSPAPASFKTYPDLLPGCLVPAVGLTPAPPHHTYTLPPPDSCSLWSFGRSLHIEVIKNHPFWLVLPDREGILETRLASLLSPCTPNTLSLHR